MKIKFADTTHIICAYRLDNPIGPFQQEAIDDMDCGMGRSVLKILKQKELMQLCVFVVHYYGQIHLGRRRFEITEILTARVIKAWFVKQKRERKQSKRVHFQSSIASAMSSQDGDA